MEPHFSLSRRTLLGGIGAASVCALLPRSISRAQASAPLRFIVVHVPEGMWNGAPRPAVGGTTMGQILDPLTPHLPRMLVLNNLSMPSRDHGPGGDAHHRAVPHMLTGTEMLDDSSAGGASVNQKIAAAIGGASPFASLQFAARIVYTDTNSKPLWSAPGLQVPAMQSPWEAYDRIFKDFVPSMSGTPAPTFDMRRSVLDHVFGEITTLRQRLPATDRELLDSYHESLRDIERRLATVPVVTSSCDKPMLGSPIDVAAESNYPEIGKLQMDMMVAALQCGITRVASLQWGNSNDQCSYSWLGVNNIGHDLAHNNNNCDPTGAKKLTVYQWYSQQMLYLLDKLASIDEGGSKLIDNTVVLWVSEFGESNGHDSNNLMWLLTGSAGGRFRTGRIVDCGGRAVNDLHTSLCNAFGIADTTFGNPAYCGGPLPNLV